MNIVPINNNSIVFLKEIYKNKSTHNSNPSTNNFLSDYKSNFAIKNYTIAFKGISDIPSVEQVKEILLSGKNKTSEKSKPCKIEELLFPDDITSQIEEARIAIPYVQNKFKQAIYKRDSQNDNQLMHNCNINSISERYDMFNISDRSQICFYYNSNNRTLKEITREFADGCTIRKTFDINGEVEEYKLIDNKNSLEITYDKNGEPINIKQKIKFCDKEDEISIYLSDSSTTIQTDEKGNTTLEFDINSSRYSADFDFIKGLENIKEIPHPQSADFKSNNPQSKIIQGFEEILFGADDSEQFDKRNPLLISYDDNTITELIRRYMKNGKIFTIHKFCYNGKADYKHNINESNCDIRFNEQGQITRLTQKLQNPDGKGFTDIFANLKARRNSMNNLFARLITDEKGQTKIEFEMGKSLYRGTIDPFRGITNCIEIGHLLAGKDFNPDDTVKNFERMIFSSKDELLTDENIIHSYDSEGRLISVTRYYRNGNSIKKVFGDNRTLYYELITDNLNTKYIPDETILKTNTTAT